MSEDEEPKLNRRERRAKEKAESRAPTRSSRVPSTNLNEVDNPSVKYTVPGEMPAGRFSEVMDSGVLDGMLGTEYFKKAVENVQKEQNVFVVWQAEQDEFLIYQNTGYDKETNTDKWEPRYYKFYPPTVGDKLNLQRKEAELQDLQRAIVNNDTTIKNPNQKLFDMTVDFLKEQCARYLRMQVEDDPENGKFDEFTISHSQDLTLAILSARYAEVHLPKYQRTRMSSNTS